MSPGRPRAHVLEELSRQAFRAALPAEWVVRPVDDDYGIDREVEIFEAGRTTGLMFKVQLKSSEHCAESGPSRRVKVEQLGYWKSLDVPVLIVYFIAETGDLFGRWAHTVGREPGFNPTAETTTVKFGTEDSLVAVRERLVSDVVLVRHLRAGRIPHPLPIRLRVDASFASVSQGEIAVRLRSHLAGRGLRGLVDILPASDEASPAVLIELSGGPQVVLRAALPVDVASIRVTLPGAVYEAPDSLEMLVRDLLVVTALTLERTGADAFAAKLIQETVRGSLLVGMPEVAMGLAFVMGKHGLVQDALWLVLGMLDAEDWTTRDAADHYYDLALRELEALDGEAHAALIEKMRVRAEMEKDSHNPRRAGRAHYNLGQTLHALGRTEEALDELELALRHDPGYADRDYFFRERGGWRWTVGEYAGAAEDYAIALQKGGQPGELLPLRADALMWDGRYEEARALLHQWEPSGHDYDGLAALDSIALDELIDVTGLRAQERQSANAEEIETASDDVNALAGLLRASDALDPRIWVRLVEEDRPLPRLLIIALALVSSGHAWAMVTAAALVGTADVDLRLLEHVVGFGIRPAAVEDYVEAIEAIATEIATNGDREEASRLRSRVYAQMEALPDRPLPFTTRVIIDPDDHAGE